MFPSYPAATGIEDNIINILPFELLQINNIKSNSHIVLKK